MRFHDMRHTAASMMVISGVDLAMVKKILGHSSIEMTMRYAHPTVEGKMNAVRTLGKQMKDLEGLNAGSTSKVISMSKVVSNSNKQP